MDEPEHFECQCHTPEHTLRLWFDDDEEYPCIYASVFLDSDPWYGRIWKGLRYIFGYKSRYGHFGEFMLRPEDADRLMGMLKALKKAKGA